jgi:hypothetical protein
MIEINYIAIWANNQICSNKEPLRGEKQRHGSHEKRRRRGLWRARHKRRASRPPMRHGASRSPTTLSPLPLRFCHRSCHLPLLLHLRLAFPLLLSSLSAFLVPDCASSGTTCIHLSIRARFVPCLSSLARCCVALESWSVGARSHIDYGLGKPVAPVLANLYSVQVLKLRLGREFSGFVEVLKSFRRGLRLFL